MCPAISTKKSLNFLELLVGECFDVHFRYFYVTQIQLLLMFLTNILTWATLIRYVSIISDFAVYDTFLLYCVFVINKIIKLKLKSLLKLIFAAHVVLI